MPPFKLGSALNVSSYTPTVAEGRHLCQGSCACASASLSTAQVSARLPPVLNSWGEIMACGNGTCGKWFWGILLVAAGGLFLADHMGYLDAGDTISAFWPVLLIVWGLGMVVSRRNLFWGLAIAGMGTLFLMQQLDYITGGVWGYVWPGLLILGGLGILFKGKASHKIADGNQQVSTGKLDLSNSFSEARYVITAQNFEGGKVSASFGQTTIDLSAAATSLNTVELKVDCSFGQVAVRLPADWRVDLQIKTMAAEVKDRRPATVPTGPMLLLKGDVMFGSVEVL